MSLFERFRGNGGEQSGGGDYRQMIEETLGSRERDALARTAPAPTIGELVGNPVEMHKRADVPCLVERSGFTDRLGRQATAHDDENAASYVEQHSESELLQNLAQTALQLRNRFERYGNDGTQFAEDLAGRIATELRFIGTEEYSHGIDRMARSLGDRLSESSGPLFVPIKPGRSSAQVYESVFQAVDDQDPELASRLLPFEIPAETLDPQTVAILSRSGVALIDDWSISGTQMQWAVTELEYAGVPAEAISIDMICASDKQLQEGCRGVAVEATYNYPHATEDGSANDRTITLTGVHSDNDYGFRTTFDRLFRTLDTLQMPTELQIPQPLLFRVPRLYREEDLPFHTDPGVAEEYHRRCREHAEFISERIENGRQVLAEWSELDK